MGLQHDCILKPCYPRSVLDRRTVEQGREYFQVEARLVKGESEFRKGIDLPDPRAHTPTGCLSSFRGGRPAG